MGHVVETHHERKAGDTQDQDQPTEQPEARDCFVISDKALLP
jgi:hypothetical protein